MDFPNSRGRIPLTISRSTNFLLGMWRESAIGDGLSSDAQSDHRPRMFTPHQETHHEFGKAYFTQWI